MKKYWLLWVFLALVIGIFFWTFLGDVEENGKEYALLSAFKLVIWAVFAIVALLFNAGYWGGIGMLLDKYFPNMPKWASNTILVVMVCVYILLIPLVIDLGERFNSWYDDYQFQKKFEYQYNVEL